MADEPVFKDFDPRGLGARQPAMDAPPPDRGVLGWARDTAIDVSRGALGVGRDLTGLQSAAQTAVDPASPGARQGRANLDALEDIDWFLKRGKTEKGQYYERENVGFTEAPWNYATKTVAGIVPYAPLALMGPVGGALGGGALAAGHQVSGVRERIRNMPEEELIKSPDYARLRGMGMSEQDARDQLFVEASDPTKMENIVAALPTVAGNVIGGGIGGVVLSKATGRTIGDAITERVLRNTSFNRPFTQRVGVGAAGGAFGGAAGMGGENVSTQMQDVNLGLKPSVDWGEAAKEAGIGALTFAPVGAVLHGGKRTAPPIGRDVESVARMQQAGYGAPDHRARPSAEQDQRNLAGAPEMMESDFQRSEFGDETQPMAPAVGGRPATEQDIGYPVGEYGPEVAARAPPQPGRAMRPEEIAYPEAGRPREATPYDVGMAPLPQRGPYVRPSRGPQMAEAEVSPGVARQRMEYGPEVTPQARPRGAPQGMDVGDLGMEYGPGAVSQEVGYRGAPDRFRAAGEPRIIRESGEYPPDYDVTRPGEPPPSGPAGPAPPPFRVPQPGEPRPSGYDPTQRGGGLPSEPPPAPRPGPRPPSTEEVATEGGRRAAFPDIQPGDIRQERALGERAESELPYADRGPLRAALKGKSDQTRGAWSEQLQRQYDAGNKPTLSKPMRMALGKAADRVAFLLDQHPRQVIDEMRRGLAPVEKAAKLEAHEVSAVHAVMDRVQPDQHGAWAQNIRSLLEGGAKSLTWNRLPKSLRDVLGDHRADFVAAVRKDPHEVARLLAGDEQRHEPSMWARVEAERGDETPTGERHGQEESKPRAQREATHEDLGLEAPRTLPRSYGEEVEPSGEAPFIRPSERRRLRTGREATEGDVGYSEEGRISGRRFGTLRLAPGTVLRPQAMRERRETRGLRTVRAETPFGQNVPGTLWPGAARSVREQRGDVHPVIEAEARQRVQEARERPTPRRPDLEAAAQAKGLSRFRRALRENLGTMIEFRRLMRQLVPEFMAQIPILRNRAEVAADFQRVRDKEANRKADSRVGHYEYRERMTEELLTKYHDITSVIDDLILPAGEVTYQKGRTEATVETKVVEGREYHTGFGERKLRQVNYGEVSKFLDSAVDAAGKERIVQAGRDLVVSMQAHLAKIEAGLEIAREEAFDIPGQRVGWRMPLKHQGKYLWWDRLADLNRLSSLLDTLIEGKPQKRFSRFEDPDATPTLRAPMRSGEVRGQRKMTEISAKNVDAIRSLMVDIWLREKFLREGRIGEWEEMNRDRQQATYDYFLRKKIGYQNELAKLDEAPGEMSERRAKLLNDIAKMDNAINEMTDIANKHGPIGLEERLMDDEDNWARTFVREMGREQRDVARDWVQRYFEDEPKREAIQREREVGAKVDEKIAAMTDEQKQARLQHVEQRADQINETLDSLPRDITGRVRETSDTLAYGLAEGPIPEQRTGRERVITSDKVQEAINKAEQELSDLETEARRLTVELNPDMRNQEYGIRGVLSPNVDLNNPANLPDGSYARSVTDYLKRPVGSQRPGEAPYEGQGARDRDRLNIRPPLWDFMRDSLGRPVWRKMEGVRRRVSLPNEYNRLVNHFLDVVDIVSGDAQLVAMTPEQMTILNSHRGLPGNTEAFYDRRSHRIFIDRNVLEGPVARRNEVLQHEFGHPMIEAAIERFPEIGDRLDAIRKIVSDEYFGTQRHALLGGGVNRAVVEALEGNSHGLTNVHEFVTTLFSDGGRMAAALEHLPSNPALRKALKTQSGETLLRRTLRTLREGFEKLFFEAKPDSLLNDAVINSLELFERIRRKGRTQASPGERGEAVARPIIRPAEAEKWMRDTARDTASRAGELAADLGSSRALMYLSNLSDLERYGEQNYQNLTSAVSRAMDRRNATAHKLAREAHVEDIGYRLSRLERTNTKAYERLQEYADMSNHYQVSGRDNLYEGANKHIKREGPQHEQERAAWPELRRRWNAMTANEQKLHDDMRASYDKRHTEMLEGNLERLIDYKGLVPGKDRATTKALMDHIIDGTESPLLDNIPGFKPGADHQWFLNQVHQLREGGQFRKLPNFHPSMRRGQWVVEAKLNMDKHAEGGVERGEKGSGDWDFASKEQADAFRRKVANDPALSGVRLDTALQEVVYAKDENGNVRVDADGDPVLLTEYHERTRTRGEEGEIGYREEVIEGVPRRVRAKDAGEDGIVRYRVKYNPLMLEFYEKQHDANQRHSQLKQGERDGYLTLSHVLPQRDPKHTYLDPYQSDRAHRAMMRGLHNSQGWRDVDTTTRAMLERDIREQQIRHTMSASARSFYLPRKNALGASKDLLRNFLEYHKNTSLSLADLRHREEIANSMQDVRSYERDYRNQASPGDPQGQFGIRRAEVLRSLEKRVVDRPDEVSHPWWSKALTNFLRLSYIDKLASPMFTALQMSEPWLIQAPVGAARFGRQFYGTLTKAYGDIGYLSAVGGGFKDAGKTLMAGPFGKLENRDVFKTLSDALGHDREAMKVFKFMEEHSLIERDTGMELATQYDPAGNVMSKGLDWSDHMVRQVNSNVEALNRAGFGLAMYREAMASGKYSEAQALELVRKSVHETAGNYNKYASAPIFNNKYFGPALQFKRYSQRMTAHWIRTAVNSFSKVSENLSAEERDIARRQLGYMVGTLMVTSGLLGLPTEPIKLLINGTSPITGFNSDDAERWVRERAGDLMGPELGMIFTRGLPRYFNLGIGTRVGADSMWTHGGLSKRPEDWWETIGHAVGGAPLSYAIEAVQGAGKVVSGFGHLSGGRETEGTRTLLEGLEMLLPIKVIADSMQAAREAAGGSMTRTRSGQPLGVDTEWYESVMKGAGLQSGRMQEAQEKRAAIRADTKAENEQRKAIRTAYAYSETAAERDAIIQQMREYNERWPEMKPLTVGDLLKAKVQHEAREAQDPSLLGMNLSRRQQGLLPRYGAYDTFK